MAFTQILQDTFENKLESNTLNTLKDVACLKTYPPKTKLCHQGEVEETFYIIVKGRVVSSQSWKTVNLVSLVCTDPMNISAKWD